MLQSSPAYIKCYECGRGPRQFSFLLCNHIICGKCISSKIQLNNKYNTLRCSCGCITYFNQQHSIIHTLTNNNKIKQSNQQIKSINKVNQQRKSINKVNQQRKSIKTNKDIHNNINNINNNNSNNNNNNNNNSNRQKRGMRYKLNKINMKNSRVYDNKSVLIDTQLPSNNNENNNYSQIITPNIQISSIFSQYQEQHSNYKSNNRNNYKNNYSNNDNKEYYTRNNRYTQNTTITPYNNEQSLLLDSCQHNKNNTQNKNNSNNKFINQFSTHYVLDNHINKNTNNDNRVKQQQREQQSILSSSSIRNRQQQIMIPNVKNILSSVTLPQSIQSLSLSVKPSISSQTLSPNISNNYKKNKNKNNYHNKNKDDKQQCSNRLLKEEEQGQPSILNELKFLNIIFNRDIQQLHYIFTSLLKQITNIFKTIQQNITSLYIEQIIKTNQQHKKSNRINKQQQTQQVLENMRICKLIRQGYNKNVQQKINKIKQSLSSLLLQFSNNKHNQNLSSHKEYNLSPTNRQYNRSSIRGQQLSTTKHTKSSHIRKGNRNKHYYQTAQTLNNSSIISQHHYINHQSNDNDKYSYQHQGQFNNTLTKNKPNNNSIQQFQTINQPSLSQLTNKYHTINNHKSNIINNNHKTNNNRLRTQNIHTNQKPHNTNQINNIQFIQKQNNINTNNINTQSQHHHLNYTTNTHLNNTTNTHLNNTTNTPQLITNYRLTQKPKQNKSYNQLSVQKSPHKRRQIVFSPPLPYCHKHLQQKHKQALNYINYLQTLSNHHQNQQLTKKTQHNHMSNCKTQSKLRSNKICEKESQCD